MDKRFAKTIRNRLADLREADEGYRKAQEHLAKARHRQAAKQAEHAADLYHGCGLGLLAKRSYAAAAESYQHVEDADGCERCRRRANALPAYWDESHHDAKWA